MYESIIYGVGALLLTLGGAGMAENITSGRGSFSICLVSFLIGVVTCICGVCKN